MCAGGGLTGRGSAAASRGVSPESGSPVVGSAAKMEEGRLYWDGGHNSVGQTYAVRVGDDVYGVGNGRGLGLRPGSGSSAREANVSRINELAATSPQRLSRIRMGTTEEGAAREQARVNARPAERRSASSAAVEAAGSARARAAMQFGTLGTDLTGGSAYSDKKEKLGG